MSQIDDAKTFIQERAPNKPDLALVLGSGLGPLADQIDGHAIPYSEIPHFPVSTAPGHKGELLVGTLFGRRCVAMRGRVHMYDETRVRIGFALMLFF